MALHLDTKFQQWLLDYIASGFTNSCCVMWRVSPLFYRDLLFQSSYLKEKCRIHCIHIFIIILQLFTHDYCLLFIANAAAVVTTAVAATAAAVRALVAVP